MLTIFLLLVFLILLAMHVSIRYSRSGRLLKEIPGPPELPILGHAISFINANPASMWNLIREFMSEYTLGKLRFGTSYLVGTRDPDDIKILLTDRDNISKARIYKCFDEWGPNGLIRSTGALWRHRRKILTPAFHPNIMKKYMEVVEEQGQRFVTKLAAEGDETVQELEPLMSRLTLYILCGAAMGVDLGKFEKEAEEYKGAIADALDGVVYRGYRPYISDWMFRLLKVGKKTQAAMNKIHDFVNRVINERQKYRENNESQSYKDFVNDVDFDEKAPDVPHKRLAMLDLLLAAKDEGLIDDQGLVDEVDTFIAAGYETTSKALMYTLMLLAENKEIQERARIEAIEVIDRCQGNMTVNDLQKLDYVERCAKEGLRILPSVHMIIRDISKEIKLKSKVLPVGTQLGAMIYDIHRDPKHWKDPEVFDPDRHLPENSINRHPYVFLPFSAGPRVCIGQKFAMMELKAILARILYNFSLEPVQLIQDLKFAINVTLEPTTPVYVKFVKLKND